MAADNQESLGPAVQILDSLEEHSPAASVGIWHEHTFYFVRVRKGKGESELEIENPMYQMSLDRSKGTRLGLKLDVQTATGSLFIKEVIGGLAFAWNAAHHDTKVRPGDLIVRVNKTEGDAPAMMDEVKKCQMLDMELHRGAAIAITAGLSVSVKRPFSTFKADQTGIVVKVDEEGEALMKFTGVGSQWICKQDYDKFTFEDSERFYLKRYVDFKELYDKLKAKIEDGTAKHVKTLPELPEEKHFGFRRSDSQVGMNSFMTERREGLQSYLDAIFSQVPKLKDEPLVAEFFGSDPLPAVSATRRNALRQRLDALITKHRSLTQHMGN